jgi:cytochrome c551/c552
MFEKENTEAGCQQCHAKDRVTDGADTLNLGRDMFSQRGCMGCHRYEGYDRETDALNNTRQNIGQLEDQITANEKMIRYAENPGSEVSDVEANALLAKATSLKVTNSLLAARIDQLNVQSKYLMGTKKVGPNLKDVRLKLTQGMDPRLVAEPAGVSSETKMPTFWRFAAGNGSKDAHLRAKMAKIRFRQSLRIYGKTASTEKFQSNNGDAGHGKTLFESRGCLACHSIGEGDSKIGGTFAANLTKVGEKSNFDYVVRWIHNPRERYAPYCPKESVT